MKDQKLENYLVRLEKSLGPISVSEKAEIITEIKSHVLEAHSRDNAKSINSILLSLGEPEQVASKYLMERGLEPKKPPRHPVVKWIVLGFLGTVSLLLVTFLIVLWKFTPFVKVSDDGVKILGGLVTVEDKIAEDKNVIKTPDIASFDSAKIKYLKIKTGSQDVSITQTKDKAAMVKLVKRERYDESKCYYKAELQGDTLNIKIEQKTNWNHFGSCDASLELKVPETTIIDTYVGSGDIKVANIDGDIKVQSGSGNIFIDSKSTRVYANTGSGDIDLLLKPVKTKTIATIQAGSGNITVRMPTATKVNVEHIHGSGKTYNEFGSSDNPDIIIKAQSGSGNFYGKKI